MNFPPGGILLSFYTTPSSPCLPPFSHSAPAWLPQKLANGSLPPVLTASNLFEEITAILKSLEFQNR